jgi:recombination protein RecA
MAKRAKSKARAVIKAPKRRIGNYFIEQRKPDRFVKTGSTMLDLALGGGWARGRIANVVGDRSSGKTLLMIEAAANFAAEHKRGKIYYREAESAFDKQYAAALGMPIDRIDFGKKQLETVEDMYRDLEAVAEKAKVPTLYIVDSLDALSDDAEMDSDFGDNSFGAKKAKKLSEMFRRLIRLLEEKDVTVLIVSQIRDKIGAMFGRKVQRTGGRALDFYATHIVFLAQLGKLYVTHRKQKRAIGVKVKAQVDKNKVSTPHREAEFDIRFGYGVNDAQSMVSWLRSANAEGIDVPARVKDYLDELLEGSRADEITELARLKELCVDEWFAIERKLIPTRSKYGS